MSYDKHTNSIKQYANNIIKMESTYDYSMSGVFLDSLVTEYMLLKSSELINYLNTIKEHQIEECESYGDADLTVTKLDVINTPEEPIWKKGIYDVKYSALHVVVECNTNAFVIIEKEETNEEDKNKRYYIYTCPQEKLEIIDYKKIIKYGDIRDGRYVMGLNLDHIGTRFEKLDTIDNGRGIETYNNFHTIFRDLRCIIFSINQDLEE